MRALLAVALCVVLAACAAPTSYPPAAPSTGKRPPPAEQNFRASDFARSDIDLVAEVNTKECLASTRLLMEKLYRRNPREWRKGGFAGMDAAVARAFDPHYEFRFAELGQARGVDAILLALKPEYAGDRVFAFGVGLASMVLLSYNGKTEFYLTDSLDAQKLYNSARNIEIAAWKLEHDLDISGKPYIYSVSLADEPENLSYERLFGKIIALQDTMAIIIADRSNRTIRKVIQRMATAVFLPIF